LEKKTALKAEGEKEKEGPDDAVGDVNARAQESKFFDPRLDAAKNERKSRRFHFVKPGKYVQRAQTLRMQQLSLQMKQRVKSAMADVDGALPRIVPPMRHEPVPAVEWWDADLLSDPNSYRSPLKDGVITAAVHHPVAMVPVCEPPPPAPLPLMLTVKERRKLQRRKRMEEERAKQDAIRFGIVPPPEPRMTLKNMTRVAASDSSLNPTQLEANVRRQMAERKANHEKANQERKLTKEQRAEKIRNKLREDTSNEVHVALFRAGDLRNGKIRYKVDIHAQEYNLTGCAILYQNCNLVVVEGGPKGIRKFIHLMLNRINWDMVTTEKKVDEDGNPLSGEDVEQPEPEEEAGNKPKQKCVLVWKGTHVIRKFKNFRFENCISEAMARKFLSDKGLAHFWDQVRTYRDVTDEA